MDASSADGTPGVSGSSADADAAVVVVVGALAGDDRTSVGGGTPGVTRSEGQTLAAVVVGGATDWNINASLGSGAPG